MRAAFLIALIFATTFCAVSSAVVGRQHHGPKDKLDPATMESLRKIYPFCSAAELRAIARGVRVLYRCMVEKFPFGQLTADDQAAAPCGSQAYPCGESNDEDFGLKKVAGQLFVDEQAAAPGSQPEDLYDFGMKRRSLPAGRMRGRRSPLPAGRMRG